MAQDLVSFVIPVRNAAATVAGCIASVLAAVRAAGGGEVVVVDTGSTDGTPGILARMAEPHLRVLQLQGGTAGGARNEGVEHARGGVLAFIDADCLVDPDYIPVALEALRRYPRSAVGSAYELPDHPGTLERVWAALHPGRDGPANWLYGGNLVLTKEVFESVGGFDSSLVSGEDVDLCRRLRLAGYNVVHDHTVRVVHLGNPSTFPGFFRQQRWHATGMLATAHGFDRPLALTIAHLAMSLAAGTWLLLSPGSGLPVLAFSQITAPLVAVAYRAFQSKEWRWTALLVGVALYWVYLWARALALVSTVLDVAGDARSRYGARPK